MIVGKLVLEGVHVGDAVKVGVYVLVEGGKKVAVKVRVAVNVGVKVDVGVLVMVSVMITGVPVMVDVATGPTEPIGVMFGVTVSVGVGVS